MIQIVNQKIFIEGKETIDPTLIGYAMIDFAENKRNGYVILATEEEKQIIKNNKNVKNKIY